MLNLKTHESPGLCAELNLCTQIAPDLSSLSSVQGAHAIQVILQVTSGCVCISPTTAYSEECYRVEGTTWPHFHDRALGSLAVTKVAVPDPLQWILSCNLSNTKPALVNFLQYKAACQTAAWACLTMGIVGVVPLGRLTLEGPNRTCRCTPHICTSYGEANPAIICKLLQ